MSTLPELVQKSRSVWPLLDERMRRAFQSVIFLPVPANGTRLNTGFFPLSRKKGINITVGQ